MGLDVRPVVPRVPGQGPLFVLPADRPEKRRRIHRYIHTAEDVAAFQRSEKVVGELRGSLNADQRWCPGGCGKAIGRERRSCGRRWCDSVRSSWASSFRTVIEGALDAY